MFIFTKMGLDSKRKRFGEKFKSVFSVLSGIQKKICVGQKSSLDICSIHDKRIPVLLPMMGN